MTASPRLVVIGDDGRSTSAILRSLESLPYRVGRLPTIQAAVQVQHDDPADMILVSVDALAAPGGADSASLEGSGALGSAAAVVVYAHEAHQLMGRMPTGLRDFLLAPFEPELVRLRVDALLEQRQTEEQRADAAKRDELLKLERDLQIGRNIQQGFLPSVLPQPEGWEITACFHPAREVAGDFYDAFYMVNKRRVGFVIADVCDKGVGAALFMSLFRTLVRSNAQHNSSLSWMDSGSGSVAENKDWLTGDPAKRRQALPSIGTGALMNAVVSTNDYILENHMAQGYFATMFFGVLDPSNGSLIYINGGHNPPVLHRTDGTQSYLKPTGPAVGMLPGARFTMGQARLEPGDILFTYTDGVTDARSPSGEFFTESRLFGVVGSGAPSAEALVDDIESQLKKHIDTAPQFDDITMLALRRAPADGNSGP